MSLRYPEALVIAADQILDCEGEWFDKPEDRVQARADLERLRGRTHRLVTAACAARAGALVWRRGEVAKLTMRPFSAAFLESYMALVGDDICLSVGGYRLEGPGVQLFSRIEGDYFAILGLPLLALLEFLRENRVMPA